MLRDNPPAQGGADMPKGGEETTTPSGDKDQNLLWIPLGQTEGKGWGELREKEDIILI